MSFLIYGLTTFFVLGFLVVIATVCYNAGFNDGLNYNGGFKLSDGKRIYIYHKNQKKVVN